MSCAGVTAGHDGTARSERPPLQLHANFQTEISSEISPAPRATEHKVIIETESHFLGTVPLQQPFLCEGVRGKGGGGGGGGCGDCTGNGTNRKEKVGVKRRRESGTCKRASGSGLCSSLEENTGT